MIRQKETADFNLIITIFKSRLQVEAAEPLSAGGGRCFDGKEEKRKGTHLDSPVQMLLGRKCNEPTQRATIRKCDVWSQSFWFLGSFFFFLRFLFCLVLFFFFFRFVSFLFGLVLFVLVISFFGLVLVFFFFRFLVGFVSWFGFF